MDLSTSSKLDTALLNDIVKRFIEQHRILETSDEIEFTDTIVHRVCNNFLMLAKTLINCAILTPKNKGVDALNDHAVQSFPGEEKVYL